MAALIQSVLVGGGGITPYGKGIHRWWFSFLSLLVSNWNSIIVIDFSLSLLIPLKRMRSYVGISKIMQRINIKRYHQSNCSQLEMCTNPWNIKQVVYFLIVSTITSLWAPSVPSSNQRDRAPYSNTTTLFDSRINACPLLINPIGSTRKISGGEKWFNSRGDWVSVKLDFIPCSDAF